ncbi:hypothetical protein C0989_005891 [Termitomyces sp. Mn162]|nr:hypothetical protein C0989_005891 [Termitomyces sp. Mn162]
MGNIFLLSVLCTIGIYIISGAAVTSCGDVTTNVPKELWTNWAMYSPYFAADKYESAPNGCQITQANILQRHGARYPTASAGERIMAAVAKLAAVQNYTDSSLDFLKNYTYPLSSDLLVPFGAAQSFSAGQEHFERYKSIVSEDQLPFVRASGSDRVIHSATNWTAGFSHASNHVYNPSLSVILSESDFVRKDRHLIDVLIFFQANNTLDDNMCPDAGNSDEQTGTWLATYAPPIAARLNEQAPGANVSISDVYNLMTLCAFESVFINRGSAFCNLFTQAEFEELEYYGDLDKYYNTGYGQELGPVQGVGYINELIARLTDEPVSDNTQTNHTLDASPETFPLGRAIYADFSHDNQMIAIYAAMGLFRQVTALNLTSPDTTRNWITSRLVPFSARMITEKLICTSGNVNQTEYVRIFVNDALQPLEFCGGDQHGLCTVDAFVTSQTYARNNGNGDFEKCFA